MINILVVGYGNVGKKAVQAVLNEKDLKLVGIQDLCKQNLKDVNVPFVTSENQIKEKIDVAILCIPSLKMFNVGINFLKKGINIVDSFDVHSDILKIKKKLNKIAVNNNSVSILSSGWDPGTDSIIRVLMEAMTPKGITYTNFGPGMSMGHTVVVKEIKGVKNALSLTIPSGAGIHKRIVYVELDNTIKFSEINEKIKKHMYFKNDDTYVKQIDNIDNIITSSHSVAIQRIGDSADSTNQRINFKMKIDNPALTAQIMISCARASVKQNPGCYSMIEIPPIDYLPGEKEYWINKIV